MIHVESLRVLFFQHLFNLCHNFIRQILAERVGSDTITRSV
jgi:hypothetical protein